MFDIESGPATIWKYPLEIKDLQQLQVPRGGKVLSCGRDPNGQICVWILVYPERPKHIRAFRIFGTGNPFEAPDMHTFIGSIADGPFMWHVFAFNYEGGEITE